MYCCTYVAVVSMQFVFCLEEFVIPHFHWNPFLAVLMVLVVVIVIIVIDVLLYGVPSWVYSIG